MKSQKLPTPKDIIKKAAGIVLEHMLEELDAHCERLSFGAVNIATGRLPKAVTARVVSRLAKRGWACRVRIANRWSQRFIVSPADSDVFSTSR